ncbi:flagellar biosynthesis regulator FlaF [Jannaschia aquimarina]|uniref:Flagellar biosynthesis regulatory protein FlaF n=1 Tax=Jannaschia aquimarina TaxID=935700 RepID=A0A0D1EHL3_9RHOB|nr:flagellar biosynthesis regulator FlaF [Jannaschia aquimarina]KIT15300.1 flagellar biosynthesis regulatory protein FlaF [Jannaschia aquimarina]SNS50734.1 flagellar protein FlaF [Jannaschia aquimarina]
MMYHSRPAAGAYAAIDDAILSPKRAEARVMTDLTRRMIAAFSDDAVPFSRRAEVMHDNRRLWSAIAAVTLQNDNEMPDSLRASLAGLAGFVERQTAELLAGRGDIRILIEINRRIIGGLSTEVS